MRAMSNAHHLAGAADADARRRFRPVQRVVHQQQAFLQQRARAVGELQRRRAGAAFGAVDDDEVRDAGLQHRLGDGEPLPRVADAQRSPGLPPDKVRSRSTNCIISTGVLKAEWLAGDDAVHAFGHAARGDLGRHLRRRAARRRGRAWRPGSAWLDHLRLRLGRVARKRSALKVPSSLRQPVA